MPLSTFCLNIAPASSPSLGVRFLSRPLCLPLLVLLLLCVFGCAARDTGGADKYRGDVEEMMPIPYTPRDDGQPLTSAELHAFKTVSDLDRHLSEEEAQIVELHFKFFVHQRRKSFERFLERSSRFLPYVKKVFTSRGIPEDISYLCMVESGGNPIARSPAGAAGLWQFMPFTGRKFGLAQNSWIDERRDPYKSTYAASDYLLKLYNDFSNWHLAVAAYNAGEGKIGRAVSGTGAKDFFDLCRLDGQLEERARLKEETRDYVPRLIAVAKIMRNLRRLGFQEPTPDMAWNLAPMDLPAGTNLVGLASHLGISWDEFSGMNPAFRRTASPPAGTATAYVPPDKLVQAVNWAATGEARGFSGWREYTVKKGDTLNSIAKRHKVSVAAIKETNGFDSLPGRGAVILIPGKGTAQPLRDAGAGAATGGVYVVQSGDTLSALAQRWGTSVDSIRKANGMGAKVTALRLGQRLTIPGNSKNKPAPAPAKPAPAPAKPAPAPAKPAPAPRAEVSAPASGSSHTVKSGDTVYAIARERGVSARAICEANNLDPAKPALKIGQRLVIPGGSGQPQVAAKPQVASKPPAQASPEAAPKAPTPAPKAKSVTVKSGDTLYSIARANGVSVKALQKANSLGDKAKLKIGQKLVLP